MGKTQGGEPARPLPRHLTKARADDTRCAAREKTAKAYADGVIQPDLVPVARTAAAGWGLATVDEPPRAWRRRSRASRR